MNVFKEQRKKMNLTQKELADMLYLDQTTISKWELDKAIPDQKTLARLADIFNVSVDYLLGRDYQDTSQKENYQNGNLIAVSEDENILITYYRRLIPSDKLIIFNMLKSVFKPAYDLPIEQVSLYLGVLN